MFANAWQTLVVGVISTFLMDLLTVAAKGLRLVSPLSPNLVGRWFASVARAQPLHADIARAAPVSHEIVLALPVHYAIGTVLAALYLWTTFEIGWPSRSLALALAFGLCTNVLPWLLMFPAMGYGFFGVNGPEGTRLFISSLLSHAFFGVGIWIGVHVMRA
jgi:DUF2938 family protein